MIYLWGSSCCSLCSYIVNQLKFAHLTWPYEWAMPAMIKKNITPEPAIFHPAIKKNEQMALAFVRVVFSYIVFISYSCAWYLNPSMGHTKQCNAQASTADAQQLCTPVQFSTVLCQLASQTQGLHDTPRSQHSWIMLMTCLLYTSDAADE